jgi:hypothetical protein
MSLPVVRHARECLEAAAQALQLERNKCAAAEEELWAGHGKFVRKCGGGEGAYLWINGEQEEGLFAEFVDHVMAPARAALVPPAARIAAAQTRMILAEVDAIERSMDPLTWWSALFPGLGGAPPKVRDRVRKTLQAARVRVRDLEADTQQLRVWGATAGLEPSTLNPKP